MLGGLRTRLERATDAFLRPPSSGPLRSHTRSRSDQPVPADFPLDAADRAALAEVALGLHDPDVRGWLVVTLREVGRGTDIDVDWRMPECARLAVEAALAEYVLEPSG